MEPAALAQEGPSGLGAGGKGFAGAAGSDQELGGLWVSHGGIWDRSAFPMAEVPRTESKMLRYRSDREQAAGCRGLGAGCLHSPFGMLRWMITAPLNV